MRLHPVTHPKHGANRFCGPAVLSALTGIDTGLTAAMIRKYSGRRRVTGTDISDLAEPLNVLRYYLRPLVDYTRLNRPTIAAWLRNFKAARSAGRIFLLDAGHHWQLVSGRRYVCGRTTEIVSIRDKRVKRRARVKMVWEVVRH